MGGIFSAIRVDLHSTWIDARCSRVVAHLHVVHLHTTHFGALFLRDRNTIAPHSHVRHSKRQLGTE